MWGCAAASAGCEAGMLPLETEELRELGWMAGPDVSVLSGRAGKSLMAEVASLSGRAARVSCMTASVCWQ